MKINKKWKFLSVSVASLMSAGLVAGVSYNLVSNEKLIQNNNSHLNADTVTDGVTAPLSSYNAYSGLQTITNRIGPMLISNNGKTFGNYDWYGNLNWSITLNNTATGEYPNSGTKVVDWNYIPQKGYLYVITDKAYMFCIDSVSGNVIANVSQTESGIDASSNKLATIALNSRLYVWNSNSKNPTVYSVDRTTLKTISNQNFPTSTNNDLNQKYLLDILELSNDIGFNIAITSTSVPSGSISSVTAYFVTNSLGQFSPSTTSQSIPSETIILTGISKLEDLYVNAFYHSITNSYILMIGNSLYDVNLSTNAMEKSTITKLTGNNNGTTITLQNINSSFVDGNNDIYFTDASKKIYAVNPDGKTFLQYYDLNSISYLSDDIKKATTTQIFPVQNSSGNLMQGQIFVATSNANFGGVSNKTASGTGMFNSSSIKPTINVANTSTFNNLIPSAVTSNNFVSFNADQLNASNVQFTVDDKNGELLVKATLTKQAWYNVSEKTTSIINAKYKLKTASDVTSWAEQDVFNGIGGGYFAKKSPNQISTEDFDKYADQVLIISPSLQSAVQKGSLTRTFVIKEATGSTNNQITVMATVSYVDQYGTFVTYSVQDKTYTVKSSTETKFAFQGQTTYISGTSLDVNTVPALSNYKGYLPSLLSQDDLSNFISVEDGYPTSSQRRIITSTANDEQGTIDINVVYIGINPQTSNNFNIKYTGFPTFTSSKIKWVGTTISDLKQNEKDKTDESTINQKLLDDIASLQKAYGENTPIIDITTIPSYVNYGSLLSTDIATTQVNLVYTTLLSNMGFQPILTIERSDLDNEYGVITIKLDYRNSKGTNGELLTGSFFEKLGIVAEDGSNKQVGVITQKFSGFLPIGSTYGVTLKDASSDSVKNVINNNNVDSIIPTVDLLSTLNIRGYNTDGTVDILNTSWNGEKLLFTVRAQSTRYSTVNGVFNFTLDWAPKFASIRERNLIIATVVSIVGVAIVAGAIAAYVMRKNKIRRLLK